jgi:hypothetical protein
MRKSKKTLMAILILVFCVCVFAAFFLPPTQHENLGSADSSKEQAEVHTIDGPIVPALTPPAIADALNRSYENRSVGISMQRPGGVRIEHTKEMESLVALGNTAIPGLVANLKNSDPSFRLIVIEMIAMLDAKEAVPALVDNIKFNDEIEDNLTIARLGAITKHPDGYKFLRRWFDNSIQQEAVHAYRTWIEDHLR